MISGQNIEDQIKDNEIKLEELKEPNDEKFLFFFKPDKIDTECIGGITLKNGVRILSVIVLYESLTSIANLFEAKYTSKFIINLIFFICYLCIGSLALFSTFNDSISFAKIAYILVCILFILEAFFYILKCAIKLLEFINPFDGDFLKIKILIYILAKLAYLFIFLYFIYVLFCFIFELKKSS